MKNKKGFTLVEVIISFSLIMIVMIYLLRTIMVLVQKNSDLITYEEFSIYENNLLGDIYKDLDVVYDLDSHEISGLDVSRDKDNIIIFSDLNTQLEFKPNERKIIYNNKNYTLPDNVEFRTVQRNVVGQDNEVGKVYSFTDLQRTMHEYYVITIHLKVNGNDEDMKIIYHNKKIVELSITYDANGGRMTCDDGETDEICVSSNYHYGETLRQLPTATYKNGYNLQNILLGWYTSRTGGTKVSSSTLVEEAAIYYAHWKYSILLDSNGATTDGSTTATVEYKDKNLSSITNPQKKVTVTYVNNVGATIDYTNATIKTSGGQVSYALNGWYTKSSDGTKVASNSTTPALQASVSGLTNSSGEWTKNNGTKLFAQWNEVTVKLPKVTKTGNVCKWSTNNNGTTYRESEGEWTFTSATERTFTVVCTPNSYTIALDANGATSTNHSKSTTVEYNAKSLASITNPQKKVTVTYQNSVGASINYTNATVKSSGGQASYTLNGWYTATSGGSKVATNSTTPALQANVSGLTNSSSQWIKTGGDTLHAQWARLTITLPKVSKSGYSCKWTTDNGSSSIASGGTWPFDSATSRTFTVSCSANKYNVNYVYQGDYSKCTGINGATKTSWSNQATFNSSYHIEANWWNCPGYTFIGWWGSDNLWWTANSNWTWTYTKDATLTAQWEAKSYTVHYVYPDVTGCTSSYGTTWDDTAVYKTDYYIQPNWWSCPGWTFDGWWGSDNQWWTPGNTWNWTYTNGVTLTAQWKKDSSSGGGSCTKHYGSWTNTSTKENYRTSSDSSCNGVAKSYNTQRLKGTGVKISPTESGYWWCEGKWQTRTVSCY